MGVRTKDNLSIGPDRHVAFSGLASEATEQEWRWIVQCPAVDRLSSRLRLSLALAPLPCGGR